MKKTHAIILSLVFAMSVIAGTGFGWYKSVQALPPYGGRAHIVMFCHNGFIIAVGPPRPGLYKIDPFTRVYAYGQFWNQWVLGNTLGAGSCCFSHHCVGPFPRTSVVGTSLL